MKFKSILLFVLPSFGLALAAYLLLMQQEQSWQWKLPAHFAAPRVPADNAMTEAKFKLGRSLFYDPRLSGNGTMACASCHLQNLAFTDGKAVATGSTGMHTLRSAQTLVNAAYHATYTWANPALPSLERQMLVPLAGENPVEMGLNDNNIPVMLKRFADDAEYVKSFRIAFPDSAQPIVLQNIIKAIAVFQRGLISSNSKYDAWLMHKATLTENEERGRALFFAERAQCSQCHSGFNFSDQTFTVETQTFATPFHNTGLYNVDGQGGFPEGNRGLFETTNRAQDMGAFRAPSLRNVAVTAPYMHDGSIARLEQVLDFYAAHGRVIGEGANQGDGRKSPMKDARIDKIDLNAQDKADLLAFLNTLTDYELLTGERYANPFLTGSKTK